MTNGLPETWLVLAGAARLPMHGPSAVDVGLGDTVLLPAGLPDGRAVLGPRARILRVTLPSPLTGMIA